jgi:hypothetical protein
MLQKSSSARLRRITGYGSGDRSAIRSRSLNAPLDANKLTKILTLCELQCIDVSVFLHLITKLEQNVKYDCVITVVSCTMSNPSPHPKSDGFGGENLNPIDSDF